MDTLVKKIRLPVQLWAMLGPLFVICIILAVIIRAGPAQWGLPLAAIVGVLLCYQWRWRGCLLACSILAGVLAYQLLQFSAESLVWNCLLFLAFAAALVATTLFLDESKDALDHLGEQSLKNKEALGKLEDKLNFVQNKLESERQLLTSRLEPLKRELMEKEEKQQLHDNLVTLVREDLMAAHSRQEKFLQELFEARQQAAALEQQVARLQDQHSQAQMSALETSQSELKDILAMREQDNAELKARLAVALEEERLARQQSENFVLELMNLREQQQAKDVQKNKTQEDQILHLAIAEELNERIDTLTKEKQLLEMTLSSLQGEFEELSAKAVSTAEQLDIQSAEMDLLKGSRDRTVEELRVEKTKGEEFKRDSESRERSLLQQVEEQILKLSNTNQQIADWQRKLNDYSSLSDRYAVLQMQIQEHISDKQLLAYQLEQARKNVEQAEGHLNISTAREVELRLELDEMTALYSQEHAKNLSNAHLISDSTELKTEVAALQQQLEEAILQKVDLTQEIETLRHKENAFKTTEELFKKSAAELEGRVIQLSQELHNTADKIHHLQQIDQGSQLLQANLESQVQHLQQAVDEHKVREQQLNNEVMLLQAQLHASAALVEASLQTEQDQQVIRQNLENQIKQLHQTLQEKVEKEGKLSSEAMQFKDKWHEATAQLAAFQKAEQENQMSRANLEAQAQNLQQTLKEKIDREAQLNSELLQLNAKLQAAATALQVLQNTENENQHLKQVQAEQAEKIEQLIAQNNAIVPILDEEAERKRHREMRRLEGLYQQMREQFNEKSKVLDDTRRELFLTQEKFQSLQMEQNEKDVFDESEVERTLYAMLSQTEAELKRQTFEYHGETAKLHGLIEVLMQDSLKK